MSINTYYNRRDDDIGDAVEARAERAAREAATDAWLVELVGFPMLMATLVFALVFIVIVVTGTIYAASNANKSCNWSAPWQSHVRSAQVLQNLWWVPAAGPLLTFVGSCMQIHGRFGA